MCDAQAEALKTVYADEKLDVHQRLVDLQRWRDEYECVDEALLQEIYQLDDDSDEDAFKAMEIGGLRRRKRMGLVRQPIEIPKVVLERDGYKGLRTKLKLQYAELSEEERLLWLQNLMFILTPDLRRLGDKLVEIRGYRSFGQTRNFLLGGPSGMGKSTYLDWYTFCSPVIVEDNRNHAPVVKIDAPVTQYTPRQLYQAIILACGKGFGIRDREDVLVAKTLFFIQKCGVEVMVVDEIQHITRPSIRRRLLEISNMTPGVSYICASCDPHRWIEGDKEVQGRWNSQLTLRPYSKERISQLLAYIELLLPFTGDSFLYKYKIERGGKKGDVVSGLAQLIEQWTGGVLRDIMILLLDASKHAIRKRMPALTVSLLDKTWKRIEDDAPMDVLEILGLKKD